MSLFAILPVKPFAQAKTRLASVLSAEERATLTRAWFVQTLSVVSKVRAITHRLVISRDPYALQAAEAFGAQALLESEPLDLNVALQTATAQAQQGGAQAIVILPTDLPHLTAADIDVLLDERATPLLKIAPDRHGLGTNALFIRPPGLIPYAFGADSFQQHQALAQQAGARVQVCATPGLTFDVDVPEDLMLYRGEEVNRYEVNK